MNSSAATNLARGSVDKSSDRVREMFAQISGRYDFMNHLLSLNIDRYWRRITVRRVPARGKSPILDLCTGTGDLAFEYWKATGGQVPIVGADFCHEMLRVARRKQCRRKQCRRSDNPITFVEATAMELPLADNHFQIVSAAFGLRNIEDTDVGLEEMVRVCQPGGRVAILEFSKPTHQPLRGLYNFYFRHVLPRVGQRLARNSHSAYEYLPTSVGEFPSAAALADRMRSHGLRDVSFTPLTFGVATLYVGSKPENSSDKPD